MHIFVLITWLRQMQKLVLVLLFLGSITNIVIISTKYFSMPLMVFKSICKDLNSNILFTCKNILVKFVKEKS